MLNLYPDFLGGTIVPSDGDISSYAYWATGFNMGLARITNGFDTLELNREAFGRLEETVPGITPSAPTQAGTQSD
jgi:hypothetical protein